MKSSKCDSYPQTGSDLASQFIYDGLGRLRERIDYTAAGAGNWFWQESAAVEYIYDGMRVIQERNSANTPTVDFTRGNDLSGSLEGAGGIGGLLARWQGPGLVWYYHADGNGNVMCLENISQGIAESSRYDAFGNLVSGSLHEFGFSSKEYFSAGGLYYYGYRWYAPSLQRWLNRDPIAEKGFETARHIVSINWRTFMPPILGLGGPNLYEFVGNNPISKADTLGLSWNSDFWSCVQMMDFLHVCEVVGVPSSAGSTIPRGPVGKVCRKAAAATVGYCAGIMAGCALDATQWNTPPDIISPPNPITPVSPVW